MDPLGLPHCTPCFLSAAMESFGVGFRIQVLYSGGGGNKGNVLLVPARNMIRITVAVISN